MSRPKKSGRAPSPSSHAWGYIRVSSAQQVAEGFSLAAQERAIRDYATQKNLTLKAVFVDEATSAAKQRLGEREQGQLLIAAIKPGDHVILTRLDRAWRSVVDARGIIDHWEKIGVTLHIIGMNVDTSTPMGKFFLTCMAAFAELESGMISERTIAGRKESEKQGRWTTLPPFGFTVTADRRLVPLPRDICVAGALLDMSDIGMPRPERVQILQACGVLSPSGQPWSMSRLESATSRALHYRERIEEGLRHLALRVAVSPETGEILVRDAQGKRVPLTSLPAGERPAFKTTHPIYRRRPE